MVITVDTREPDKIVEWIEKEGGEYEEEYLNAGDFIVGSYLIERKRYGDLIGRINQSERDLWQQMLAVDAAAKELDYIPVLLTEGEWGEAMQWSNMTPKPVTAAIGSIFKMDISIVHVMGPRACAQFLIKLDDDSEHDIGSVRDSPSLPDEYRPQHLIEGFPGIGPSRAQDILERFGSLKGVIEADVEELIEIDGIGEATARKIYDGARQELPDDH